jgi:hypothetical protein
LRLCLAAAAALGLAAAASGRAHAAGGDYDPDSVAWNGLATLSAVARGMGLDVVAFDDLRFDELRPHDALLLLYPTRSIDPGRVSAFARRGGRVVVADDFGAGGNLLSHFGVLRRAGSAGLGARLHGDLAFAPIAEPRGGPLAADVRGLVTNHPAVFTHTAELEPSFAFPSGEVLVAAGEVGAGRIVALADPSVLINRMLELEDNLQFAINLLRYLDPDGRAGRLVVVSGDARPSGVPPRPDPEPGLEGQIARALEHIDDAADELRDYIVTEAGLRAAALLFATLVAIACFSLPVASRRRGAMSEGSWVRAAPGSALRGDVEALLQGASGGGENFVLPAAVLRDNLDRRLGAHLGCRAPLTTLPEHELYRRVDAAIGREAALALARIVPALAQIPAREHAAAPHLPTVSRRAFDKLHSAVRRFERALPGKAP